MANDPELTEQMPWVSTEDGRDLLDALWNATNVSRSAIIRHAYNTTYGLTGVGHLPPGTTIEELVAKHAPTLGEKKERHTRNEV